LASSLPIIYYLHPLALPLPNSIADERVSRIEVFGTVLAFGGVLMIMFDPSKVTFSLSNYLSQIYLFTIPLLTVIAQSIAFVLVRIMEQSLHYIISPTYLGISTVVLGALSLRGYVTQPTMLNTFLYSLWDSLVGQVK
jgi:drug/metabolite transporter (DMT)-like permease